MPDRQADSITTAQRPATRFAQSGCRVIPAAAHIHEVTALWLNPCGKIGKIALNLVEKRRKTDAPTRHSRMTPGTEPRKSN